MDWCPTPKKLRELHGDSLLRRQAGKIAVPGGVLNGRGEDERA